MYNSEFIKGVFKGAIINSYKYVGKEWLLTVKTDA
jgi:hypothetical protein